MSFLINEDSVRGDVVDVFIIGAGPAGLTAAYCLTKETPSVVVAEKDPDYVGGISRTIRHHGFLFDIGGHRFFSKSREIVDLWHEILPADFIERPRLSRIYYNGKYFSYPLKAVEALATLGPVTSFACILSYLWARAFPIKNPRTFHDWVRNEFGERLFQIFFKTYTEKVWGISCDEISADWAVQRIKGLDLSVAVRDAVRRSFRLQPRAKAGETIKSLIERFEYPRRGPGMMWEAAARKVEAQGGRVLMGRELEDLNYDPAQGLWQISLATKCGTRERYIARHIISSAPVAELIGKIFPAPQSLKHAVELRYRDFITVALMIKKPSLFADNWIYIHDSTVRVGRVQNFGSWSPEMVPDMMSCLGLEYFCFEGDGLWTATDAELIALATSEAAKIGLITADDVSDGFVVRQPKAYPIYDDFYREHMAEIRSDIEANYPALHLVGRNGMHKYNNQDHAMMTAMLTARNILAGRRLYDVWNVNEDAQYQESGPLEALIKERLVPRRVAVNPSQIPSSAVSRHFNPRS
jgi:protoporphyrinogen oxidase